MSDLDLNPDFSEHQKEMIRQCAIGIGMLVSHMGEWILAANAIANATAELAVNCEFKDDAQRKDSIDNLCRMIKHLIDMNSTERTKRLQ